MMKFKDYQKEFLLFLELERGYSDRTIEVYRQRFKSIFSIFIQKNKIQFTKD